MSIEIIQLFIPKSNTYTRPGIKMTPTSITDHETDNTNVRANARAHALLQRNGNRRQASWHFQVDDEREVYQSIPVNEVAYHAGTRAGNYHSIAVERCVNKDGDYLKTIANTIVLYKFLLKTYPTIKEIKQHNHWSGKNCPRLMRQGHKGMNWSEFIRKVRSEANVTKVKKVVEAKKATYQTLNTRINVNQKVTLKQSATHYATGERIPDRYKGKMYTVQQRGSNRVLLKELYSWVHINDLEGISKRHDNREEKAKIKVGSKVTLRKTASIYVTGEVIPNRYKNKNYTVQQVKPDRVLLKELYSWVKRADVVY